MGAACECHGRDGRCDFLCHVSMVCGATFEWLIMIQPPWFVAGVIMGIPASIAGASTITGNRRLFSLLVYSGGLLGGIFGNHIAHKLSDIYCSLTESFSCYDVLTRGAGPICLIIVALGRSIHSEPSLPVKHVALVALIFLVAEPLYTAHVASTVQQAATAAAVATSSSFFWSRRRTVAEDFVVTAGKTAICRARWLNCLAQLLLWAVTMRVLAKLALSASRASRSSRQSLGSYLGALEKLAEGKRNVGGWVRSGQTCVGGGNLRQTDVAQQSGQAKTNSVLGKMYDCLAGGKTVGRENSCLYEATCPNFERGEVTARGLYCIGLDAALTGRMAGGDADGGGGLTGNGDTHPFYVTLTLGNITARTSRCMGFTPVFSEVFPLGIDCPVRGAHLVLEVVDSFETGRSGRGDRVVGEVSLPIDSAELDPQSLANPSGGGPTYRLKGDWELHGVVGPLGAGVRVGAEIAVKGPAPPDSMAGRLLKRESIGWYAR